MTHDALVFIGRFQPFHKGHEKVIDQALRQSKKTIVLIGSAGAPRDIRNPFTFQERKKMIQDNYPGCDNLVIEPLADVMYNDPKWEASVQSAVYQKVLQNMEGNTRHTILHGYSDYKIGLIGREKDHTSYYLKKFPQWDNIPVEDYMGINATDIRAVYFDNLKLKGFNIREPLPKSTDDFLGEFLFTKEYDVVQQEVEFNKKYAKQWEAAPYPPTFVTTDSVVVQSGHVLLVKRGGFPGKGLLALPGGFLNQHETIEDGMIRELREETKIKVPEKVLRGSIEGQRVFDHPNRSTRGRTITHAFLLKLEDREDLPKIKGSDDAEKAMWVEIGLLKRYQMFEDHYDIIQCMLEKQ